MAREDFRSYAATVKSQFPGKMPKAGKERRTYEIYTQDRLLLNYRGAVGVKTGWTTKARGTFVGAATRGGRTLVASVLNTDFEAWRESAALLTWGFRNAGVARPVGTLDAVAAATPSAAGRAGPRSVQPSEAAAAPSPDGWPWYLQVPVVLLGVVAALRARVLVRNRVRRRAHEAAARRVRGGRPGPAGATQSRDLRRLATAATAAPIPAPTKAPRHRDPDDGSPAASAATGTRS
jgi:D-alanyl-D-alanine carboxypeptidase (penicillin-binding protein 5/6)